MFIWLWVIAINELNRRGSGGGATGESWAFKRRRRLNVRNKFDFIFFERVR